MSLFLLILMLFSPALFFYLFSIKYSFLFKIFLGNIIMYYFLTLFYFLEIKSDVINKSIILVFVLSIIKLILNLKNIKFKINYFYLIIFINTELFLFITYLSLPIGDSLAYWFIKAKFFSYNLDIKYLPVPDYPNFISIIWSYSAYFFEDIEIFGRLILAFFFFAGIFIIFFDDLMYEKKKPIKYFYFFILSLIYLFFSGFSNYEWRYLATGYVDIFIFIFLYLSIFFFFSFLLFKKNWDYYFFSILFLGILPSIKNEGLIISLYFYFYYHLIFFIFYFNKFLNNRKYISVFLFIYLILYFHPTLIKMLYFYKTSDHSILTTAGYFNINNLLDLNQIILKSSYILKYFFFNSVSYLWIFLIIFILLIEIYKSKRKSVFNFCLLSFLALLVLNSLYIFFLYNATILPFQWHLQTSFDRIYFQIMGSYVALVLIFFKIKFSK